MTALYGHNFEHAVNDYIHQRRQIWASKVHAHAKVIALAIVEHMQPGRLTAEPSKQRLMRMCNMSRSTFERYYLIAKTLFNTVNRSGRTCVFEAKTLSVATEILALWPVTPSPDMEGVEAEPTPNVRETPSPNMGRGKATNPPSIWGGVPPLNMGRGSDQPPPNMGDRREVLINNNIIPASTVQEAAREQAGLDEIGLNDASSLLVTRVAKWINPYSPDYKHARNWVTSTLALYGEPVVRDAFADMETKLASGSVIGAPLKLLMRICQDRKERSESRKEAATAAKSGPTIPEGVSGEKWLEEQLWS